MKQIRQKSFFSVSLFAAFGIYKLNVIVITRWLHSQFHHLKVDAKYYLATHQNKNMHGRMPWTFLYLLTVQCKSAELSKFHKSMKKAGHGTDRRRRLSRTTTIHTLKNDGITSRADRGQFTSNQENFELVRCRLRFIFDSCFKSFKISVNI